MPAFFSIRTLVGEKEKRSLILNDCVCKATHLDSKWSMGVFRLLWGKGRQVVCFCCLAQLVTCRCPVRRAKCILCSLPGIGIFSGIWKSPHVIDRTGPEHVKKITGVYDILTGTHTVMPWPQKKFVCTLHSLPHRKTVQKVQLPRGVVLCWFMLLSLQHAQRNFHRLEHQEQLFEDLNNCSWVVD